MINTSGINRVLMLLQSDLNEIAIGSGTAPSVGATALTNQTYRKTVTTSVIDGAVLVQEIFFDEADGNGAMTELGLFGSTGQLFASGAASLTKDNTQSLTVSFEIEVKEVN
jgi:hypothetical protein